MEMLYLLTKKILMYMLDSIPLFLFIGLLPYYIRSGIKISGAPFAKNSLPHGVR